MSVNSFAVAHPELLTEAAKKFGSQCVVVAIDAKWNGTFFEVYTHGGRTPTGLDAVQWAQKVVQLGAGELLLTSMDADGTKAGFDMRLTKAVTSAVEVPVIASGGADAALAASLFHYKQLEIMDLKRTLAAQSIPVRI